MNNIMSDASSGKIFLFGEPQLNERFVLAIELLAQIVVAAPRSVSIVVLADTLGQPMHVVRAVLSDFSNAGLVCLDTGRSLESWKCLCETGSMTLADVFRAVSTPTPLAQNQHAPAAKKTRATNVDLLLMQAAMEINQGVMQHLQRFNLGRLKAIATAKSFFAGNAESYSHRSDYR
jgi:DNA-binding IscR family transcriptional regulator